MKSALATLLPLAAGFSTVLTLSACGSPNSTNEPRMVGIARLSATNRTIVELTYNLQQIQQTLARVNETISQVTNNLQRMQTLTVHAANDTLGTDQRDAIEAELDELASEITRIGDSAQSVGRSLLNGSIASSSGRYVVQIDLDHESGQDTIDLSDAFREVNADSLMVDDADIAVTDNASAAMSLSRIDAALNSISTRRATIGAYINRLEAVSTSLQSLANDG